jgi:hypothetical protein
MIEYGLIILLQFLGIGFHVMQKISGLGDKFPEKTSNEIALIFWKEDWDTMMISVLVITLNLVAHFILMEYTTVPDTLEYFYLYVFGSAFLLGYAGQRIIYKQLGTAEKFLDKTTDKFK